MSTILETLQSINSYPISIVHLNTICIDRALIATTEYTLAIGASSSYRLATADTYFYLSNHPNLVEQEVGINNAIAIKKQMRADANDIYGEFDDPKFTGFKYGFIGEGYNDA